MPGVCRRAGTGSMITGFNTDVEYEGRVFHVQTEDKGRANPVVESLVYSGGEIVDSLKTPYDELARSAEYSEDEVLRRMETQHQSVIRDITSGKYDPEGPKPFGYNIITNRSLDAVVLEFLSQQAGVGQIRLEMERHQVLVAGQRPSIAFRVLDAANENPVPGAHVVVKLISTQQRPRELFAGETDAEGRVTAEFEIPVTENAEAAIVCQAEASGTNSEIKQLIRKAAPDIEAAG